MAQLTANDVHKLAMNAGLSSGAAYTATLIAYAESGFNTNARGVNTDGSVDRGLWQINNKWNPDVNDQCAYDPICNATAMARVSNNGTKWTPWSSFNNGIYKKNEAQIQQELGSTGSTLDNAANGLTSGTIQTASTAGDMLGTAISGMRWFADLNNLKRILAGILGLVAVMFGVYLLQKDLRA